MPPSELPPADLSGVPPALRDELTRLALDRGLDEEAAGKIVQSALDALPQTKARAAGDGNIRDLAMGALEKRITAHREQLLWGLHKGLVLVAKKRYLPDDAAHDVAQDVILALLQSYLAKASKAEITRVSFGILRRKIAGYWQDRVKEGAKIPVEVVEDVLKELGPDPLEMFVRNEADTLRVRVTRLVVSKLSAMEDLCRKIIARRLVEVPYATLSKEFGPKPEVLRLRHFRCLEALRKDLGGTFTAAVALLDAKQSGRPS